MAKKKKDKISSLYDENGRWVQERNRIKGAIRRAFRLFPQMKDVLEESRVELPPKLKKDGSPGKKNRVRYKCAICGELFQKMTGRSSNVQCDHINPVVPLWKKEKDMTYDELVERICCKKENLQVVCSVPMKRNEGLPSCHKKKTDEENWIRRELAKDMDYETLKIKHKVGLMDNLIKIYKKKYKKYLKEKKTKRGKKWNNTKNWLTT